MYKSKRLMDCTISEITTVWNEAFSNYAINFSMTVDQMAFMVGKSELSPEHSIVIFDNNLPIGFVLTSIKMINGTKTAWNGGTGVSPNYQGLGIGKLLMNELMDVYQKIGVQTAVLEVLKDNTGAISLYEKYGFQKTGSLSLLELNKENTIYPFHMENDRYVIENGLAADVHNLPFHNDNVAWSHQTLNIHNGQSILIKDHTHLVRGYGLFTEVTRLNGEKVMMIHQCEVDPSLQDKETVLKLVVSTIHLEAQKKDAIIRTGDFGSSSEEVVPFLKQIGFRTLAERFHMTAKII
jgi:ribosomal protein S18 acetylase RimI-like enzyme